ncbi:hypothetical protein GCM10010833_09370 [Blastomonas aquatica]|uniref:Phosphoesterase n=2 Tax=Blastomonas aquatica TaxID=1510276 RepID=A0ABQ1J0J6_9SPHN|nr:hypothetical protein GCM10010833_09370 [Blastomonas aquatica]
MAQADEAPPQDQRRWLAGDHHVHSVYSARYRSDPERPGEPPEPLLGGDAWYPVLQNAQMARRFGLDWMVSTDHGGPGHSQLNYDMAWPDVVAARAALPDLVLFYGMEFDVPGGEHASLILPINAAERDILRQIEAGFGKREAFPDDSARNTKERMIEALRFMAQFPVPPIIIANHPSRTATGPGLWGRHTPAEYRAWHDAAPNVVIGMEGAPGHQAAQPKSGLDVAHGSRGLYGGSPTLGGFDQMVATLGGAWDGLLGQGLRWTITATSDSHGHWSEGGADFWPGEYAKTWVYAKPEAADIMDGLRSGRVFVATGGLIDRLEFTVAAVGSGQTPAAMGDSLAVDSKTMLQGTIRFRSSPVANAGGATVSVDHVDLIAGDANGQQGDSNPTTRVVRRFTAADWQRDGESYVIRFRMPAPDVSGYLRLRGSSTDQAEPAPDVAGENPWDDLWFYSNPVYLRSQ